MPSMLPLVPSIPDYSFATTIEGASYTFGVRWNASAETWTMSVFDEDGIEIVSALPILLGTHIGRHVSHALFKEGAFVARDLGPGGNIDAGLDDLGSRVIVVYYTAADIVAARYANAPGETEPEE